MIIHESIVSIYHKLIPGYQKNIFFLDKFFKLIVNHITIQYYHNKIKINEDVDSCLDVSLTDSAGNGPNVFATGREER